MRIEPPANQSGICGIKHNARNLQRLDFLLARRRQVGSRKCSLNLVGNKISEVGNLFASVLESDRPAPYAEYYGSGNASAHTDDQALHNVKHKFLEK